MKLTGWSPVSLSLILLCLLFISFAVGLTVSDDDEQLQREEEIKKTAQQQTQQQQQQTQQQVQQQAQQTPQTQKPPVAQAKPVQAASSTQSTTTAQPDTKKQQPKTPTATDVAEKAERDRRNKERIQSIIDEIASLEAQSASIDKKAEKIEEKTAKETKNELYVHAVQLIANGNHDDALPLLVQSAASDHPKANCLLGNMYLYGKGVEMNFTEAFYYYNQSAALGNAEAQREIAFMYDTGKGVTVNHGLALLYYTFAARAFDTEALLVLAYKYSKGYGVPKSCPTAVSHLRLPSESVVEFIKEQGHDHSFIYQIDLVTYVNDGENKFEEEEDRLEFMEFSALNAPSFMTTIGQIYKHGSHNRERDYEKAIECFTEAVRYEEADGAAYLGSMYDEGKGVPQDFSRAKQLYSRAISQKSALGYYYMGRMYAQGRGVPKNYDEAIKHYLTASQGYNYDAMVELGKMFLNGEGVPVDFGKALNYFQTAAIHAHGEGQLYFAKMISSGIETQENCLVALSWYRQVLRKGPWVANFRTAFDAFVDGNIDLSLILYEKLARQGFEVAQANAAYIYYHNLQSKQFLPIFSESDTTSTSDTSHYIAAFNYYKFAADQNNANAYLKIGDYFYYGIADIPRDLATAANYYRQISSSSAQAMFNLGYMHQYGEGLTQDLHLAKRYYDNALKMNPDSYLATNLALLQLGFEYTLKMYRENHLDILWSEAIEFFTPSVFSDFFTQLQNEGEEIKDTTGKKGAATTSTEEESFLDFYIFGYTADSLLLAILSVTLLVAVLFRFGIVQIHFAQR